MKRVLCLSIVFLLFIQSAAIAPMATEQTGGDTGSSALVIDVVETQTNLPGPSAGEAKKDAQLPAQETQPTEPQLLIEEETPVAAETTPVETAPEETVPEETEPEQTVPGETLPETLVPEETVPEATEPEETEPETVDIRHDVPLYFQNDYPYTMYGYGTVESSGCSITCLAMVASYMTDHAYLPDELAGYFGGRAANNMARLEYGSDTMQLPYEKNTNWHTTLAALQEGKIAIVLMNKKSVFTDSQHFVVLTGITADGRILVNDPYLPNYGNPAMALGFVDGFSQLTISTGFSGAWVYDKSAMPEEPFLYHEEKPEVEPRYPEVNLDREDRELLAKVVWVEARGESFEGQQAVAEVILNRLVDDGFPDSLRGIIFAEGQFRSAQFLDEAKPYQTQYEAVDRALNGPYVLSKDVFYFATYPTNDKMWGKIGGHIFCYRE